MRQRVTNSRKAARRFQKFLRQVAMSTPGRMQTQMSQSRSTAAV
jgi:hypothetical protein